MPNQLGNPIFQERYNCKWNYCAGSMYSGVSSESLVIKMAKSRQLSFFGSAGLHAAKLEDHIKSITAQLKPSDPYGMCMISNINSPKGEFKHAELFVNYNVPVIEASAYSSITLPLVYCRLKGLTREGNKIRYPRRIIGKCSRMEIARLFLSPPPAEMVNSLFEIGLINEEEKKIAQIIPMADDLAIEADSGGHTDQGVVFPLIPSVIALREELRSKYQYQDEILIGCGGGIGTPEAIAAAFMLGADFVFTGSINQCTVESGAHDAVKDILNKVSIHDTAITVAGDMFEIGAKVQVVKKYTKFHARANKLYQLFMQYNSIEDIPQQVRTEIESKYFKRSFSDAWDLICEYKKEKNPNELKKAAENPRTKMALIFKWYFAYCNQLTLRGEVSEIDNFKIYCGPAMGAFNLWVKGTPYEHWRNRNVDKIAELLMQKTCEIVEKNVLQWFSSNFRTIEKS
nr:PfaD family polyunsaturated fatty acid/polyketide biosynthesis protein [Paenibacillus alba]